MRYQHEFCLFEPHYHNKAKPYTVELRLSELIKTRGDSDKLIVRIIEQHAIHMKLDHIQYITKYSTQEVHGYLLYITSSGNKVIIHFFVLNLSLFWLLPKEWQI